MEPTGETWTRDAQSQLQNMESHLVDAAVALSLYLETETIRLRSADQGQAERQSEYEERRALEAQLEAELPPDLTHAQRWEALEEIRFEAERRQSTASWEAGSIPEAYLRRLPFLHARSFLFAADGLFKSLRQLRRDVPEAEEPIVTSLNDIETDLKVALPDVIPIRDSAHHKEERVVAKAHGKPIDLSAPIDEPGLIRAPAGGVLLIDGLVNGTIRSTVADGRIAALDVTPTTLSSLAHSVQRTVDSFSWSGPRRLSPSR